ncbi:UDP-N-acetylmuramoyl-L-alanine--D-glutamate ligase [Sphingorhabdus sp. IMCC26285]|uniref:UDP-N-acetylmuramoylalanine--D-glutamate ligase n=1 Tax=Sphingorhabdus profundilacus TaxID=2509718 RepID=A0A6I4M519_9SPHN|nr:UDP-N-acetylmuramoyl-L-alanine--D-glutamate ligase [Sphingorhabdus profundilacus]MVZ97335.1 UDP-N-acetylmuramoyl-L-alanine--D-glutamate ligase [Sphingorhabdus profundilacus]
MITSSAFKNRKFALLGLARSGLAAARSLVAGGADILAWDNDEGARAKVADIATIADPLGTDLSGYAAIVVSPGVPINRHPIAEKARAQGIPLIGDIELFSMARADLPPHRVVGITGTNGKSTTTALVHHLLKSAALPARMGGNIGLPILSQVPLPAGGVYVLELSSYQIDLTKSLACDAAALINLSPDHLDRYDGCEAYFRSKARLFDMQTAKQHSVFGKGDEDTARIYSEVLERRGTDFVHLADPEKLDGQLEWPSLQGPHNLQNIAVAVALVESLGLTEAQWRPALRSFKGLAHRMEVVKERNGVLFVNDSKATNAASTAPALAAYPRVHWIVGGLAKSDNLDECIPNFGHVVKAYTIGEAGPMFTKLLSPYVPVESSEMMGAAVHSAAAQALPGDVIMLSPACASFDQFKDFEARGDAFKAIVEAL